MSANPSVMFENGCVLVDEFVPNGTLIDVANACKKTGQTLPKSTDSLLCIGIDSYCPTNTSKRYNSRRYQTRQRFGSQFVSQLFHTINKINLYLYSVFQSDERRHKRCSQTHVFFKSDRFRPFYRFTALTRRHYIQC